MPRVACLRRRGVGMYRTATIMLTRCCGKACHPWRYRVRHRRRSIAPKVITPIIKSVTQDGSGTNVEKTMAVGSLKPRMLLLGVLPVPAGGKLVLCVLVAQTPSDVPLKLY